MLIFTHYFSLCLFKSIEPLLLLINPLLKVIETKAVFGVSRIHFANKTKCRFDECALLQNKH